MSRAEVGERPIVTISFFNVEKADSATVLPSTLVFPIDCRTPEATHHPWKAVEVHWLPRSELCRFRPNFDRGAQLTSTQLWEAARDLGILQSVGRTGCGNAMQEWLWSTLKTDFFDWRAGEPATRRRPMSRGGSRISTIADSGIAGLGCSRRWSSSRPSGPAPRMVESGKSAHAGRVMQNPCPRVAVNPIARMPGTSMSSRMRNSPAPTKGCRTVVATAQGRRPVGRC